MVGAAGVGMGVGEQDGPAVGVGFGGQGADVVGRACVEGQVVQAGAQAVMLVRGQGG